jgi:hypothetical protein
VSVDMVEKGEMRVTKKQTVSRMKARASGVAEIGECGAHVAGKWGWSIVGGVAMKQVRKQHR